MKRKFIFLSSSLLFITTLSRANNLPNGFVYLQDIDPTIQQEMRYFGNHNFLGRPVKGYNAAQCILTVQAANALSQVQKELSKQSLGLKVYDCYRPQMAVDDFIIWSQQIDQQQMKNEFYPRVDKADFFKLGYVAAKSGHTRGSTMDLTVVPIPTPVEPNYQPGEKLVACFAPYGERFEDNSIDMGTGFDCMDELAHPLNESVDKEVYKNRMLLREFMVAYGFVPYEEEWWHFTLKDEPFKDTYFNFPIEPIEPIEPITRRGS